VNNDTDECYNDDDEELALEPHWVHTGSIVVLVILPLLVFGRADRPAQIELTHLSNTANFEISACQCPRGSSRVP
jgi:hypothetical protein